MIKEKADSGDELSKGVQDTFGEKPDAMMVRFIRARKYDVARAFELMKGEPRWRSGRFFFQSGLTVFIKIQFKDTSGILLEKVLKHLNPEPHLNEASGKASTRTQTYQV